MIDKLKIQMGRNIPLDIEASIFVVPPKVREIVDIGEDEFQKLITPFILTTDAVFNGAENEEELISKFKLFDLFFLTIPDTDNKTVLDDVAFGGKSALKCLVESLSFFLDTNDIRVLNNRHKIIVKNSYIIDRDSFNKVRKVIQDVVGRKDIEVEKPPKNMSKRQADIWRKLQKGRRRKAEREAYYLQDIINFVSFGGKSYIPSREIDEMTYYQLHNAYKCIMGVESYYTALQYKLSQKFDVKDKVKHWSDIIKIGK